MLKTDDAVIVDTTSQNRAKWCQEKEGLQRRGKLVPMMEGEAGDLVRQMKLKSEQEHVMFRNQVEAKLKIEEQRVAAIQHLRAVAMEEKRHCQSTRFKDAEKRRHQVRREGSGAPCDSICNSPPL